MTIAFTFPGQGSQFVGMGADLAEAYDEARLLFEEVDDALSQKLTKVMWDGPVEELTMTANTQPALMAVSMAVMRVLAKRFGQALWRDVKFVAGHSLGEYSALAATGALSFEDCAKLLRVRGQAMQEAVPAGDGAMAALLGVDLPVAQEIANEASQDEVCQAANDNAPGQVVLSGTKSAVERAVEIAPGHGARRAVLLPVSAPFHCALMKPAQEAMAVALEDVKIQRPCVPLVANVLAQDISDPEEIRQRLVEQVTGMVRWRESVAFMAGAGVTTLYELGAGKVLSGLARRIERDLNGITIGAPADIEAAGENFS